jgi:hypothetical protein
MTRAYDEHLPLSERVAAAKLRAMILADIDHGWARARHCACPELIPEPEPLDVWIASYEADAEKRVLAEAGEQ